MCLSFLVSHISLEPLIGLGGSLSLLELALHVLHELSQLTVLFIAFLQGTCKLRVFLLHLTDDGIALLKLLLNDLKFLRVSESILRSDNFLELVSESSALFHVELDLNFDLLLSCAPDITLECLSFVGSSIRLSL